MRSGQSRYSYSSVDLTLVLIGPPRPNRLGVTISVSTLIAIRRSPNFMSKKAGEVTAQTRSKSLQLGAIFRAYSKVRTYLLYLSKQLYNPQQSECVCVCLILRLQGVVF